MRWVLLAVMLAHGLIHFMGFAKAFGLAELPRLTLPISRAMGVVWLVAGLAMVSAAILIVPAPRWWWAAAVAAAVVSQIVVVTAWADAKLGTVANVVVLAAGAYAFASQGPTSFSAQYQRQVAARLADDTPAAPLTEVDLAGLPAPVQCYVRRAGAVGQPRVHHFEARWRGRIRASADGPWMEFTAEQTNFVHEPARLFSMKATRAGLPVDVLHAFVDGAATMKVRLLSVLPIVDASGPELTRAETVTLLNDMSILAPGALVDPAVRWTPVDSHSARAHYTVGDETVSALLRFDDDCDLVDFVSDDRSMTSEDGERLVPARWSTPSWDHRAFGVHRAPARGEGRWHPPDGDFAYIEIELVDLVIDGRPP